MKRQIKNGLISITVAVLLSVSCGRSRHGGETYVASDTTGTAVITFNEMEHDFGTIKAGEHVGHIFSFTNTGDADLIISSATASCGCTVSKHDKKPVSPQGKGTIEVNFDSSDRSGKQTKTVVIQSNAENKLVILRIIALVQSEEVNLK